MRETVESVFFLPQEGASPEVAFGSGEMSATTEQVGGGDATGTDEESGGGNGFWVMLALLFVFMWLFVIRPESKRRKQTQEFQTSLQKGDDVVTAGGLHGTIASIDETTVTLKVSDSVRMKFDRNAVGRRASAPAEETAKIGK
jgi:preprotein translocase subunit YajC